jgi:glycosyltransferase involved in cell wall biosynthesis
MTRRPLFSVVIPTVGRPTLPLTLASIDRHYAEIIVVADTHGPLQTDVGRTAGQYGARYLEVDAGAHDTGSPQLHVGFALAEGQYILNCGDDDVYEPEVFDLLAEIVRDKPEPWPRHGPVMFKVVMHPNGARGNHAPVTLWERPAIERFNVTGQSFVCPNVPGKVGRWVDDVTLMRETVALWDGRCEWREEVIAQCY